jgi:UPF0716 protein FxsA
LLSKLILLFIIVPFVELFLLIEIGQLVGTWPTIGLVIFTGVAGAYLARHQGLQVLRRLQSDIQTGGAPAEAIFDGVFVLVAALLLMTPGVLTDLMGLLCLFPPTRRLIKRFIWSRLERTLRNGQLFVDYSGRQPQDRPEKVIILDHDDYK